MIASVTTGRSSKPCIVYWTGNIGSFVPKIVVRTYCDAEVPAGDGVSQLPDKTKFCEHCTNALAKAENAITE